MTAPLAVAAASALALAYVFGAYLLVLKAVAAVKRPPIDPRHPADAGLPPVTCLVAARNEAVHIGARIDDLLDADFPPERLSVLVVSDGSTDGTDAIVDAHPDPRVSLCRAPGGGKSAAQNLALERVEGGVVVFTDADTRFERSTLRALVEPFADPSVGCTTGAMALEGDGAAISAAHRVYWGYEMAVRTMESRLRVLAVATGACMAARRELLRPFDPGVGEDCVVPLDVVEQGLTVVHVPGARAVDRFPKTTAGELRTRARMTQRNWVGTWSRPALLNPFRHPGYAAALWSHKLLRWLSPLFLLGVGIGTLMTLWTVPGWGRPVTLGCLVLWVAMTGGGWAAQRGARTLPLAGHFYSFLVANIGFAVGVYRAVLRRQITRYR